MAKKKSQVQAPAGTAINNCSFTVQTPGPEPTENVEKRVEAVKALAEALRSNADALGKTADALRGSPQTNDNTCIKIG